MNALEPHLARVFAHLQGRLDYMVRVAELANGARWPQWFEERAPIDFHSRTPDAVWLVRIHFDRLRRFWQFDVERVSTMGERGVLSFRDIVDEEKLATLAAAGVGPHIFRNALRNCLEGIAGPSRNYERLDQIRWPNYLGAATPPKGVAIEDSRPVPGSDLHEVRVQLPSAAPPPEPPAAGEPKPINFREFL